MQGGVFASEGAKKWDVGEPADSDTLRLLQQKNSTTPIHFKTLLIKVHRFKSFICHSVTMTGKCGKILSLYDDQINAIKRGKAGAKVQFGNKPWIVARMAEAEKKRKENQEQKVGIASARVA